MLQTRKLCQSLSETSSDGTGSGVVAVSVSIAKVVSIFLIFVAISSRPLKQSASSIFGIYFRIRSFRVAEKSPAVNV